jgi:subtilisin-like proprotein convertase family protein
MSAGLVVAMFLTLLASTAVNSQNAADNGNSAAPAAVFTNTTPITIPAVVGNGDPYPSPITVTGLPTSIPATPDAIKVTINGLSHTFPDDFGFVLVAPNGDALLLQDGVGDGTDIVNLTYTFSDSGATQLPTAGVWAAGTYKPTTYYTGDSFPAPGPLLAYGSPGPTGGGTATFQSTFAGDNPNGVWNLFVRDFVGGDGGMIAGGWSLEIAGSTAVTQNVVDFDGNNRTDFATVRNTGGGPSGQVTWFYQLNGVAGPLQAYQWGLAGDFFVPDDYDGDNKTDIAVWRGGPATVASFYVLNSQTSTVRVEAFGQTGDDPTVVGDYNNDGRADLAVYRAGVSAGQQSTWYYRTTANGPVTFAPWGINGDFPAPGDYDGDGSNDLVVQRNFGGGQAAFWRNLTTAADDIVVFGTATDLIVPGDYDGDAKTDLAVVRGSGGQILWFWEPSGTAGFQVMQVTFGISASDFVAQGDYDGDGKTDPAVWRPSATPGSSAFWYAGSTSGAFGVPFGQNGDYPVANYNSH